MQITLLNSIGTTKAFAKNGSLIIKHLQKQNQKTLSLKELFSEFFRMKVGSNYMKAMTLDDTSLDGLKKPLI